MRQGIVTLSRAPITTPQFGYSTSVNFTVIYPETSATLKDVIAHLKANTSKWKQTTQHPHVKHCKMQLTKRLLHTNRSTIYPSIHLSHEILKDHFPNMQFHTIPSFYTVRLHCKHPTLMHSWEAVCTVSKIVFGTTRREPTICRMGGVHANH